ncbi:dihydrofolate reductase [Caenimonas aquaedulcis]|uniref:Dihydrofolate reductase n=1 Tax=Caenimonas aquaedulcis TaxID=2793270 RepID=A0A931H0S4_9BURK|nr:dihydrofolate reductase [Caenimonas aquaedulcis]MBG9386451.1 dihydrofolate reductase [Caenimonas aquaedulcis]
MTRLGLVFARARNGIIGKDGVMPWHLPADMAHFKQVTMGAPVIMGRKTWESLPPRFRPLPGRSNIVVTRQSDWQAPGATRVASLEEAVAACAGEPRAWIIGGGQIYEQAAAIAHDAEVTEIDADFDGDTYAPQLGAHWQEQHRESHLSTGGLRYSFVTLHNTQRGD